MPTVIACIFFYLVMTMICAVVISIFMLFTDAMDIDEILEIDTMIMTVIVSLFWFLVLPLLLTVMTFGAIMILIKQHLDELDRTRKR